MKTSDLFDLLKEMAAKASLDPSIEATVFVNLTDPDPAQWQGSIKDGQITLDQGEPAQADISLTASSDTAIGLFNKTINPMMAVMTGKLKVSGDVAKVALLKNLLTSKK